MAITTANMTQCQIENDAIVTLARVRAFAAFRLSVTLSANVAKEFIVVWNLQR
jgi:hypothetical protein